MKFGASANAKSLNTAAERGNAYHRKVYKGMKLASQFNPAWRGWELLVEPWFREDETRQICSPDAVLLNRERKLALVVEVKLNHAHGKDEKLLNKYLPVVSSAFEVTSKPCLVVQCLRGYPGEPLKGLSAIWSALDWQAPEPTPVAMVL